MRAERVALDAGIAALESLWGSIEAKDFADAIAAFEATKGKIVVTGMGKAGLIGQKISATLRSTGQPSAFLDPAQALHGDMGMIGKGDSLLALSNSGKTDEVVAVARYCAMYGVPVVAITSRQTNSLARLAQAWLSYPIMPEGCPIRRAPMASTLQMLALGDALAARLMSDRGFTEADFLALHHGGYLGRTLAEELSK